MNQSSFYPIEIRIANKKSWFTPAESNAFYATKYARNDYAVHWWGDGSGAGNHDNIVNYFLNQGNLGRKSTNYVLSDNKITLMVSPDNVAWTSGAKGNPISISVEHQPTLGAEGYKKSGWLLWQLEGRYGKRLNVRGHREYAPTACPGSIDMGRIRAEANKWASGGYLPKPPVVAPPVVVPTPAPTIRISYSKLPLSQTYTCNKNTDLWDFNTATWAGFVSKKKFLKGDLITIAGIADNHNVKAQYGMTAYSFGTADVNGSPRVTTGINMKDLDLVQAPTQPMPVPPEPRPPVVPPATVDKNVVIAFLEGLITAIKEFITKLKG